MVPKQKLDLAQLGRGRWHSWIGEVGNGTEQVPISMGFLVDGGLIICHFFSNDVGPIADQIEKIQISEWWLWCSWFFIRVIDGWTHMDSVMSHDGLSFCFFFLFLLPVSVFCCCFSFYVFVVPVFVSHVIPDLWVLFFRHPFSRWWDLEQDPTDDGWQMDGQLDGEISNDACCSLMLIPSGYD